MFYESWQHNPPFYQERQSSVQGLGKENHKVTRPELFRAARQWKEQKAGREGLESHPLPHSSYERARDQISLCFSLPLGKQISLHEKPDLCQTEAPRGSGANPGRTTAGLGGWKEKGLDDLD